MSSDPREQGGRNPDIATEPDSVDDDPLMDEEEDREEVETQRVNPEEPDMPHE